MCIDEGNRGRGGFNGNRGGFRGGRGGSVREWFPDYGRLCPGAGKVGHVVVSLVKVNRNQ